MTSVMKPPVILLNAIKKATKFPLSLNLSGELRANHIMSIDVRTSGMVYMCKSIAHISRDAFKKRSPVNISILPSSFDSTQIIDMSDI